jgi:serine protease Do
VGRVFIDSPADDAGLRASDVITTFAGEPVSGVQDLIRQIRSQEAGGWTSMVVMRGDDELDLDVRLSTRPEKIRDARPRVGWIGVEAIELPPTLREHFGAPEDAGVMISDVAEGSPAEAAGFDLGDVLFEIDGTPVGSTGKLRELVAGGGVGNEREFLLMRGGSEIVLESDIAVQPERVDDSR